MTLVALTGLVLLLGLGVLSHVGREENRLEDQIKIKSYTKSLWDQLV